MKPKPKTKQQLLDEIALLQQRNALLENLVRQDRPSKQTAQPLEQVNAQALECLSGGGEMGALMRALDWSATPLGPITSWPESLRMAVSICLNSRFPIVIWWGSELILLYNDAWRPVLGVTKHPRALGSPGRDVWPEIWDIIGPQFASVLSTGQATWSDDLLLVLERNGYLEEAYFTYSYSPIKEASGQVSGVFAAVSETTGRVIGERRLRTLRELATRTADSKFVEEACERTAAVFAENAADVPFALLYLLDVNAQHAHLAKTSGLETNTPASPLTIDLQKQGDTWPLADVVQTGQVKLVEDLETRFSPLPGGPWPESPDTALILPVARSGQEQIAGLLVVGVSPRRALDDDYWGFFELVAGHVATALTNARAYEEERRQAESLAELDRAKTAFFSNVSHEFRTPLTLMLGPLEDTIASMDGSLSPDQREQLEMVHRNGLRLLKLVNTLLDFSRIEAGRVQANYEPIYLADFTAELAGVFRSAIERAGLRLLVECPPLPEPVYADRDMWEKIVLNLLSNAFKFTFKGEIAVSMYAQEDKVELVVRDTGTGIPPEELPHLFERFHRVEGARGRTHEGSGIGLALVQELVRLHGGAVGVTSAVGEGTTFTVTIPTGTAHLPPERISVACTLTSTAVSAAPYVEEALRWLPDGSAGITANSSLREQDGHQVVLARNDGVKARILLADDNSDMRDYVKRLLSERYEVEAVANGFAALSSAQSQVPDLVLSDVMMPGIDGFALLKALRAHPDTREVPVILLSARAGEESRIEGLQAGADDYLVKPFSARELVARVQANLEMARVRQEVAKIERIARTEAEAARKQVSDILESISDAFIALDHNWRYVYANQEALKQVRKSRAELIGQVIWEVFPDAVESNLHTELHRAVQEQIPIALEEYYTPFDTWYEVHAYPSKSGLSVYFQDITQRKRLEEELRQQAEQLAQANRMKDEFLATVSHELRTPLNSILGWTQMLRKGSLKDDATGRALETIERNARSQNQLIEDLLDVSRIISGKLRLDVRPIELTSVIEAALDTVRPATQAKAIRLTSVLDPGAGPVAGDANRLQQVVWNLLSNAIKFTPKGGRVQVQLERVNSHVEIIVSDTGQGIDAELLPYIFERFRQADSTTTRQYSGLGLGLAIVRHLVELHGGTVWAESLGEGQGAVFIVHLPLQAVRQEDSSKERVHPRVEDVVPFDYSANLEGLQVLVVDDEPDARELVTFVLEQQGAEVMAVASIGEALEAFEAWRPDVLLSDIGIPGEDGYSLIRKIRVLEQERGTRTPAAALTAYARAEDRTRSLAMGYQLHLPKPIDPSELVTVVANLAGRTINP